MSIAGESGAQRYDDAEKSSVVASQETVQLLIYF